MFKKSRAVVLVVAIGTMGLASAQIASAKTKTVKYKATCKGKIIGATGNEGTCKGTFGKLSYVDKAALPNFTEVQKLKGGTISIKGTIKITPAGLESTWKVVKGTGKYKGIKGKGTTLATRDSTGGTTAKVKATYKLRK